MGSDFNHIYCIFIHSKIIFQHAKTAVIAVISCIFCGNPVMVHKIKYFENRRSFSSSEPS